MKKALLIFLLLLGLAQIAEASILFEDDFQSGTTGEWKGNPGKGDIRLSRYKDNLSLRLQGNAFAVHLVPTRNYNKIQAGVSFAAQYLRAGDACILEVGFGGDQWTEIGRIVDGQDDGLSLHKVSGPVPKPSAHKLLIVRLRVKAKRKSATCWADEVMVRGQKDPEKLSISIPHERFFSQSEIVNPFVARAFAPSEKAGVAYQKITGTLSLSKPQASDGFSILKDDFGYETATGKLKTLPAFSLDIISDGDVLIPLQRGPQRNEHPDWEWVFQPGKIWSEPEDKGWSRATLPIALQERNANCIHNGLLSFLFKDGQVSNAIVEIGSETCAYLQFNMWSHLPVSFQAKTFAGAQEIKADYHKELGYRLPRRPITDLPPDITRLLGSPEEVSPQNMTSYGYVMDHTLYASKCPTRFGDYPYCAAMPVPSYSMAKSMVASIGLMRLEKLYPGARNAKIADYVPQCPRKNWGDVTFENVLDMSTGNYASDEYDKDEASSKTWAFMNEETHAAKIKMACTLHKRRAKPGKKFVYHTTDTYILGTAMQAYLRRKTGDKAADFYADIVDPIWQNLHLSPLSHLTRRTRDQAAQAFTGWGLTLQTDDIARMALLLQNGGRIEGKPWLDQDLLASALQKNPHDRGLRAVNDSLRYRAGFWAYNAGPYLGCKGDIWIPSMSGFGGLATVLMPNGHVYFYISDGHEYAWRHAAKASNNIKPFCEKK